MLRLLAEFLPDVEVTLWPNNIGDGVEELLRRNFPKVRIAQGEAVKEAFAECDFLLHGSGASFVAAKSVAQWVKETGKPYGVVGITFSGFTSGETKELCDAARFLYYRDTVSLARARELGIACPIMDFGPDAAFGVHLRDDARAAAFLSANDLQEGKFLCCIPRLRYTPYWLIPSKKAAFDERKNARNEEMKEHDHAPLREAIIAVVRQTPMKILLCPEDMTQMAVGKELIFDKLPEDVRPRVVWRQNYWLTDEALSTYVRSAGLFGNEMHSPIMALGNGVPAIVCRWAEQTTKGLMWRDIGLGDWLFDLDQEAEVARLAPTVLALAQDPGAAKIKAARALAVVRQRQKAVFSVVDKELQKA
jgi:polysaccharide pyruvyl transferase WcaK-like protein